MTDSPPATAAPRMSTTPGRKGKHRCRFCGDTLHRLANGWGHDKDNFACCLDECARRGRVVTAEPMEAGA